MIPVYLRQNFEKKIQVIPCILEHYRGQQQEALEASQVDPFQKKALVILLGQTSKEPTT